MKLRRRELYALLATLVFIGALFISIRSIVTLFRTKPTMVVGKETISLFVADTESARKKGLGGREGLEPGQGMLFVFEKTGVYPFWMKDMRFPIDIVWLDENLRIVSIVEDATPESYPNVFTPEGNSRYVLEIPAGFVKKNFLARGDVVKVTGF